MEHILLLHGAIGAKTQLNDLATGLGSAFTVHQLNFSGHGGSQHLADKFSIELFAEDVLSYLNKNDLISISVFGYSMGGYVALYLARHHPKKIKKIVTLATKFTWDESIADNESAMLQPEKIQEKLPEFAESLRARHAPADWKQVLQKTAAMLADMGKDNPLKKEDYKTVQQEVLLLLGDKDKMVTLDETEEICNALPNARLQILTDTPHPIERVNTAGLTQIITGFLA